MKMKKEFEEKREVCNDWLGLIDLREDVNAPIIINKKDNEALIKLIGNRMKLSDGFILIYIDDFFLISPTGNAKLLISWELHKQGKRRWVKPIRYIQVDQGITNEEVRI